VNEIYNNCIEEIDNAFNNDNYHENNNDDIFQYKDNHNKQYNEFYKNNYNNNFSYENENEINLKDKIINPFNKKEEEISTKTKFNVRVYSHRDRDSQN
jgi:hypothetical protein